MLTVDIDKCYDEWNFDLINVSHGPNSVLNSFNTATITKQDLNLLLRMIFAFDFTKKNIQKKFFEEKTTAEIQKLTYKDVENLKKKESEILKVFYNRIHDILQHRNIQDAQFYLDEVFGKDYINLDDYILSYLQNEHRLQSYFESKNKINTEKQKNKLLKESFPDIFDEK